MKRICLKCGTEYEGRDDSTLNEKEDQKMTYTELRRLLTDADDCKNFEQYLAEVGGSLDAEFYEADGAAYNLLADVWKLHENHTYKTLAELSGISNRQLAIRYNIPIRTAENWHSGVREITDYLLDLLAADVLSEKYK